MTARNNPFATARLDAIPYRLEGVGVGRPAESVSRRSDYRAAIVGPHGSGKSTLLEALAERIPGARLHRFPPREIDPDEIILLDSAERLGPARWLAFRHRARRARGLVITAHTRGRLPVLIECRPTAAILDGIVRDLLGSPP